MKDDADLPPVLTPAAREALQAACAVVIDEYLQDIVDLAAGRPFAETAMAQALPPKHLLRYSSRFARAFLVCAITVVGKLRSREPWMLACVAEELALRAIVEEAQAELAVHGLDDDLEAFEDECLEDVDFELLFDPQLDGVEDLNEPVGSPVVNLRFEDWFKPFRPEVPVHPFVEREGVDPEPWPWTADQEPPEGASGAS